MKSLLLLAALVATGCASVPRDIAKVDRDLLSRFTYKHYAKRDWRYIQPGTKGSGNCAVFAFSAWVDLAEAGRKPTIVECSLITTGERHAYTAVDGWALDIRRRGPIPVAGVGCR